MVFRSSYSCMAMVRTDIRIAYEYNGHLPVIQALCMGVTVVEYSIIKFIKTVADEK